MNEVPRVGQSKKDITPQNGAKYHRERDGYQMDVLL